MFQVLNKVTGGKPRATRRSSGGRRVILKALSGGLETKATFTLHRIAFHSDVKKHISVASRNAIFRGIIAKERCCFALLLKIVHSISDRFLFAPLRKAIR
jgi:hypothetical protein